MLEREIDIAMKIAGALVMLQGQPKAGADMKIFMVLDQVAPYELSVADLEKITGATRGAVGVAVATLTGWGYITEKGGMISRAK